MKSSNKNSLSSNSVSFEHIMKETDPKNLKHSSFTNDQTIKSKKINLQLIFIFYLNKDEAKKNSNSFSGPHSLRDSESSFKLFSKMPPNISARKPFDFSRTSQLVTSNEIVFINNIDLSDNNKINISEIKIKKKDQLTDNEQILETPLDQASPSNKKKSLMNKQKSKLYNLISQFYITEKFIQTLLNWTIYRKTKKLKKTHFEVINDLAFYQEGWRSTKFDKNSERKINLMSCFAPMIKELMELINKRKEIFVFHPTSFFKVFWDFLHLILIIAYLIIIPLEMSFDVSIHKELPYSLSAVIAVFFELDILVNLNTAIYEQGKLTINYKKIISKYFRSSFFFDIISIFYFFDFSSDYNKYLGILFFLRINTLRKIIKKIQGFVFMDETTYYLIYLIKLVLTVLFISHIFSCLWHYVAIVSSADNKENWLDSLNLSKADWNDKYVNSFYFVVVVMNTVGFGDIVPKNNFEKIFAIFFIYFACYIFAFSLNIIGIIVQTLNKKSSSLNSALLTLNVYMSQKHIPLDLRVRIKKYLEFLFKEEQLQTVEQAHAIIHKLSPSLQEELLLSANGIPLRNIGIFSSLSESSLRQLTLSLREVTLTPGDLLFSPFQPFPSLYIILSGEIELFLDIGGKEKVFCKMGKGRVLKEKDFITGFGGEEGGRSSGFSKVVKIEPSKFLEIIKNNSKDFEKFCVAKQNTIFATKPVKVDQRCEGCGEEGHLVWKCNWVCLNVRKQGVIAKHCWDSGQKRTGWERKRKKRNALKLNKKCKEVVRALNRELFSEEEEDEEREEEEEVEKDNVDENPSFSKKLEKLKSAENSKESGVLINQKEKRNFSQRKSMILSQLNKENSGTFPTKSNKSNPQNKKMDGGGGKTRNKDKLDGSSYSFNSLIFAGTGQNWSDTNSSCENQAEIVHNDNHLVIIGNVLKLFLYYFNFFSIFKDLASNSNSVLVKESIGFDKILFETAKNYNNFFPHNNIEVILQKLDLDLERKLKRRKTFKRVESTFAMIEKKMLNIQFKKEKKMKEYKNRRSWFIENNLERSDKKEILTKVKIIRLLKEIEKRRNRRKGRFYRLKIFFKNIMICLIKLIMNKCDYKK